MIEQSVFDRFPEKYRINTQGGALFRAYGSLSEEHDKWLPETHFPIVGFMPRHPRYNNRRSVDPFVEMYYNDVGYETPQEWGLPAPNEEASYKSLSKYAKDTPFMDDEQVHDMNRAWRYTATIFYPYMQNACVRPLEPVVDKLDKTTSSGAPFNTMYATKGELLEHDPTILETFAQSWELLASDPNHTYMCTNSLKEEIRPTEKTLQNKIRTFTAMAVDATVDGNRLFADMNEKMNSAWLTSPSTVGWSPMNGNWARLIEKLQTHPNGYALDESEYDSSLRSYMMWGCARFRWTCLREEDRTPANLQRIKTYYRNLVNTLIISPEGVLILKLGGNPSGSCNTINDNTLILMTLLSYAWIRNVPEKEETSVEEFLQNVSMALCGDDNTWTVSDEAHPFFNGRSVCEEFSTIGVITTSDCYDPRPAEDLDYLSAHTVYLKGIAVPQYNRGKILTSLLYSNKAKHTPANALMRAAGMLVCGYTDPTLRKFLRELISWLLFKFDRVCADEPDWIVAKTSILSDQRLFDLWTGTSFFLHEQSFRYDIIDDGGTKRTMSSQVKNQKKSQSRRGKGAKATRKPKIVVVQQSAPKRGRKQGQARRARGNRPRRNNGQMGVAGRVLQGNFGGQQMLRNPRNMSKPRIEEFDERIASVNGSVGLTTTAFPLNPANATTFPWLNKIAQLYERYEFEQLEFYFQHDVSGFATQGQTGLVYLSALYDAASPAWTTETQIVDSDPRVFGMPNENMCLSLAKEGMHPKKVPKFCRPGILPGGADIKEYDAGNLFVSTVGEANTTEVGKLQIKGRVKLYDRILDPSQLAAPVNNQVSFFEAASAQTLTTAVPTALLLATADANGLNIVNTAGSFVPAAGNYLVDVSVKCTDSANEAFTGILNFQKNAVTVLGASQQPAFNFAALGAGEVATLNGTYFVTANGTDAFRVLQTLTGAAGTLTAGGAIRFVAI